MKNEIIFYQSDESPTHIEIRVDEERETFWLSLQGISDLFERDKSVISRHLKNIFTDKELEKKSVVAFFATTATDGKTYQVEHFNLDAILSVGYRVNSKRGTQFRIWANNILKEYLIKGYAINNRIHRLENKIDNLESDLNAISLQLKTKELPAQGIFFDGQIFNAYVFLTSIIKEAEHNIILIDNYVDETVLVILSKRNKNVKATIYTKSISPKLRLDLVKHNSQYPEIKVEILAEAHDRFLLLDDRDLYHLGASLKDLGKKWFAFSKMNSLIPDILSKLGLGSTK
ncbi:virulence RhuM family protein [Algoriphagus confluentis]|uniref:RhuM family protein n=1 Tax=Algoriphagus confluentis TaxID=1697556 RepID=A0ABQ6PUL4_9BACT|nr:RhuM family protein [Algoriphagus confluentis]